MLRYDAFCFSHYHSLLVLLPFLQYNNKMYSQTLNERNYCSMDDYEKLFMEISEQNIKNAIIDQKKSERYQNRFNYFNCILSVVAVIISLIALFK